MGWWIAGGIAVVLLLIVLYDVTQKQHAIVRNFPIVGHLRYWLEAIGPELRQYIVTNNNEERPFSRDQRRWVYASSKAQNNYFGFGTDNDLELSPNFLVLKHSAFPLDHPHPGHDGYDRLFRIPSAKILGGYRNRAKAFRPASAINISGMSFGSLSGPAVEALNRGSKEAGCLQNTGEGGISEYHLHGGELIWQIGTAYFGCRDERGKFDIHRFRDSAAQHPVRAIEIKLSQGAKPGAGGMVPAAKVTPEIARIRGIVPYQDCISPTRHSEFHDVDSMLDFVERLADESGLPVGIKSAVGESSFWRELVHQMATTDRGVDFINIDGGEGGTGAAPLVFADRVALPFKIGLSRVYKEFAEANMQDNVVFVGAGKLGFPEQALFAFAMGCDMVNVGRTAMLAIGCIQAQRCHTGHCPTGVATQNRWLMRGLDPTLKSARLANYVVSLRKDIIMLAHACGKAHPGLVTLDDFEILDDHYQSANPRETFGYRPEWGIPGIDDCEEIHRLMEELRDPLQSNSVPAVPVA